MEDSPAAVVRSGVISVVGDSELGILLGSAIMILRVVNSQVIIILNTNWKSKAAYRLYLWPLEGRVKGYVSSWILNSNVTSRVVA